MVERRDGPGLQMYRVSMPLPVGANSAHAGQWHVLLALGRRGGDLATHALAGPGQHAARYNVMVQAYSNLNMAASLAQSSNEPGATIHLRVSLREYDQPLTGPANVRAELTRPDGGVSVIALGPVGHGAWETSLVVAQVGVYRFRIMADGRRPLALRVPGCRPVRPGHRRLRLQKKRDTVAATRFLASAIGAHSDPAEVTTDCASTLARAIEALAPAAVHDTRQYANNRVEADHGRLKARLRPMRGLERDRTARVIIRGHAFIQNLRRGHYGLGTHATPGLTIAAAFDELALAI